jgi:hypothetical protein
MPTVAQHVTVQPRCCTTDHRCAGTVP